MKPKKRTIPRDLYDALHFSALAFGGVGAGRWWDGKKRPLCIHGHALAVDDVAPSKFAGIFTTFNTMALYDAGLSPGASDDAVRDVNARRDKYGCTRITWEEFCAETGLTRGRGK